MATFNENVKNTQEEKKTLKKLELDENAVIEFEPSEFRTVGQITRISSDDLARKIALAYKQSFHDLVGVFIGRPDPVNNQNDFSVRMWFEQNMEPLPDGKIRNLINLVSPVDKGADLFYKQQVVQHRIKGDSFTLNDETKILLSDVMYGGRNANKPKSKSWEKFIHTQRFPLNNGNPFFKGGDKVYVVVSGLDIRRLLRKIYGAEMVVSTAVKGDKAESNVSHAALYEPRVVPSNKNTPTTFMINIERFDRDAVQNIMLEENPQMQGYYGGPVFFG